MKCFIISSFKNLQAYKALRCELHNQGHSLIYDWVEKTEGRKRTYNDSDQRSFLEAELQECAKADLVFLLMPSGMDAMVEAGATLSHNVPVVVVYLGVEGSFNPMEFEASHFNNKLVSVFTCGGLERPFEELVRQYATDKIRPSDQAILDYVRGEHILLGSDSLKEIFRRS